MAVSFQDFSPYSTLASFLESLRDYLPRDEAIRAEAYEKYDQLYWNDPKQYKLRLLEDEDPVYVPNARRVVDTTSHYLLKGLHIGTGSSQGHEAHSSHKDTFLDNWLRREAFYSKFAMAKVTGVARGDWVFHVTADPNKPPGERVSINSVHPGKVILVPDDENVDRIVRVHLIDTVRDDQANKTYVKKLTYEKIDGGIWREEALWDMQPKWYAVNEKPKKIATTLPLEQLPSEIDTIPVFWFKNIPWQGQVYGSSELRGFEFLAKAVSQAATDTQAALALEGLGVYATDGGRPVDDNGEELDYWDVAPGKVMEVPLGGWFRRVEGVGSITPMQDQIKYLEHKAYTAAGLSDVALGEIDIATAQSGIALAIKFMPTLAKLDLRDTEGLDTLNQMFYNLRIWWQTFDVETVEEITPSLGDKLPSNKIERLNELNNMFDRKIISKKYYRAEMHKLGYDFPEDIDKQIADEMRQEAELRALSAPPGLQENAIESANGKRPPPPNGGAAERAQARNARRVNESNGTEA